VAAVQVRMVVAEKLQGKWKVTPLSDGLQTVFRKILPTAMVGAPGAAQRQQAAVAVNGAGPSGQGQRHAAVVVNGAGPSGQGQQHAAVAANGAGLGSSGQQQAMVQVSNVGHGLVSCSWMHKKAADRTSVETTHAQTSTKTRCIVLSIALYWLDHRMSLHHTSCICSMAGTQLQSS
jgi:hypothetical protein